MCIAQSDSELRCRCTEVLPDKSMVRLCDIGLANGRKPCPIITFPTPDKSLLDPACPRCSKRGDYVLTLKQAVHERKPGGEQDEYEVRNVEDEVCARYSDSVQFRNANVPWSDTMNDASLIDALKDATDYVIVEREHPVLHDSSGFEIVENRVASPAVEEFDEVGAPESEETDDSANLEQLLRDSDNQFRGKFLTSFAKWMLGRR